MFVAVLLIWQMDWGIAFPAGFVVYLLTLALTGALREEEFVAVRRFWRDTEPERVLNR